MRSVSMGSDHSHVDLDVDVSNMSKEELIAHNLKVVQAHFHNETPESVDKAIALYAPNCTHQTSCGRRPFVVSSTPIPTM
jgi:hypothetical protein